MSSAKKEDMVNTTTAVPRQCVHAYWRLRFFFFFFAVLTECLGACSNILHPPAYYLLHTQALHYVRGQALGGR